MLKKLIIIENNKEFQFDTIEELVKVLIDKDFYDMSQNEKVEKMKMKALANCLNTNMKIIEGEIADESLEEKFIIKDEITYILSLLRTNNVLLLERKDANIFTKYLNKENFEDNYIILNTFAKEILDKYIKYTK